MNMLRQSAAAAAGHHQQGPTDFSGMNFLANPSLMFPQMMPASSSAGGQQQQGANPMDLMSPQQLLQVRV